MLADIGGRISLLRWPFREITFAILVCFTILIDFDNYDTILHRDIASSRPAPSKEQVLDQGRPTSDVPQLNVASCGPTILLQASPFLGPKAHLIAPKCGESKADFHGQFGEDSYLRKQIFCDNKTGVFVELGGRDGLLHSNTLFFEECLGWKGAMLEAKPGEYAALCRNRPEVASFNMAAGSGSRWERRFRIIRAR